MFKYNKPQIKFVTFINILNSTEFLTNEYYLVSVFISGGKRHLTSFKKPFSSF